MIERTAFVMGTPVEIAVEGETRSAAVDASEVALGALEAAEARLSTWRETSELARLNRSPVGSLFVSSPELWSELRAAVECRDLTAGGFDPSVGALVRAWGLRSGGRRPSADELANAIAAVGLDALEMSPPRTLTRRRDALVLEEGAFGKGAGLDRALESVAATPGATAAVIDLGGQVSVWRAPGRATPPITIAVADASRRDQPVVALAIDGGSLSTTGNSERGITVDGRRYSHVLDPRTGLPATDLGSVTVWAPTALAADCLSTGLFVLGIEEIGRFTAEHPELGVVVLRAERDERDRRVAWASASLRARLTALATDVDVRFFGTEALSPEGGSPMVSPETAPAGSRVITFEQNVWRSSTRNSRAADHYRLHPGGPPLSPNTARSSEEEAARASIHAASSGFGKSERAVPPVGSGDRDRVDDVRRRLAGERR